VAPSPVAGEGRGEGSRREPLESQPATATGLGAGSDGTDSPRSSSTVISSTWMASRRAAVARSTRSASSPPRMPASAAAARRIFLALFQRNYSILFVRLANLD
jgi:hypothetical protein